jgi:hypothetical protein
MRSPLVATCLLSSLACLACGPELPDVPAVDYTDDRELDDMAELPARELSWRTPIDEVLLGEVPDDLVDGATIFAIVSSEHVARPDELLCSDCHFAGADIGYRPDIAEGEVGTPIDPHEIVDGRSWAGGHGWAARFIALDDHAVTTKPAYLRAVFDCWRTDGER